MVVRARSLLIVVVCIAFVLAGLSLIRQPVAELPLLKPFRLALVFQMGRHGSIPAWYGSDLLLVGALVWSVVVRKTALMPLRRLGRFLVLISILLAVDQFTDSFKLIYELIIPQIHGVLRGIPLVVCALFLIMALLYGWSVLRTHFLARRVHSLAWLLISAGYIWPLLSKTPATLQAEATLAALLRLFGGIGLIYTALLCLDPVAPLNPPFNSGRRLAFVLLAVAFIFLLLSGIGRVLQTEHYPGILGSAGFWHIVDVRDEGNLPTMYSYALLFLGAALLWLIAAIRRRENAPMWRAWAGLAVIFVYLSMDEAVGLHEKLVMPIRAMLPNLIRESDGLLTFGWVIPFGILVVIFALTYIPFLRHLPPDTRRWIIASGIVYVIGALVFDLFEGYAVSNLGNTIRYVLETVEEFVEMLGVIMFIYTLIQYLYQYVTPITLSIRSCDRPHGS